MSRAKEIVKVSIWGIVVNLILVGFKAAVGLIANSISITLDAVNNLTDAMSSIITILGVKLAGKRPDAKHPFGYGRVEYFSAVIVAVIVLVAGVMALKESIEKIIMPEEADYSVASLVIVAVAVLVKFFFGQYVRKRGKTLNSKSLVASGVDAISDAAISLTIFVGALISSIWHISLEGYLGVLVSAVIIKTAVEILKDGVDDLIGARPDEEMMERIRKMILKKPEVSGVYDLALHNYGPNKVIASAHIQVGDELHTREIHRLSREIEVEIYEKTGVILTLGVYAANENGAAKRMKRAVEKIVGEYENLKQMHGFYVDEKAKTMSFDLIFSFDEKEMEEKVKEIRRKVKSLYPDYKVYVVLDTDIL